MPIFSWSLSFLRPYRLRVMAIVVLAMVEIGLAALAPWPMKAIVDNVFGGRPFPGPLATVADTLTNGSVESLLILVALAGLGLQLLLELVRGAHTQVAVDTGQRMVYTCAPGCSRTCRRCRCGITSLGRTADSRLPPRGRRLLRQRPGDGRRVPAGDVGADAGRDVRHPDAAGPDAGAAVAGGGRRSCTSACATTRGRWSTAPSG